MTAFDTHATESAPSTPSIAHSSVTLAAYRCHNLTPPCELIPEWQLGCAYFRYPEVRKWSKIVEVAGKLI
ncbi:hypothetical protein [Nocardiopsis gilva]|uniref:hypothetical protein n=1 Tax=Nocardiopsis gilva TaxID=280236 RepID=UPI0012FDFFF5|nr:hypothetical protein [Nocardiopsis gilva]